MPPVHWRVLKVEKSQLILTIRYLMNSQDRSIIFENLKVTNNHTVGWSFNCDLYYPNWGFTYHVVRKWIGKLGCPTTAFSCGYKVNCINWIFWYLFLNSNSSPIKVQIVEHHQPKSRPMNRISPSSSSLPKLFDPSRFNPAWLTTTSVNRHIGPDIPMRQELACTGPARWN